MSRTPEQRIRELFQPGHHLLDVDQLMTVVELAEADDAAAKKYLNDSCHLLDVDALFRLFPLVDDNADSEQALCRLMRLGIPAAENLLGRIGNPKFETLQLLCPMPLNEGDERYLVTLVTEHGCASALKYLRRNPNKPESIDALQLLCPGVDTIDGIVSLYRRGYFAAAKLLDQIANDSDDERMELAAKVLIDLDRRGNISHKRREGIKRLSHLFALPRSHVSWDTRLRFALLDCGVGCDESDWGEHAAGYTAGLDSLSAHELVAENMHLFAEVESVTTDTALREIACDFECHLRFNAFEVSSDHQLYKELSTTGFVGVTVGCWGEKSKESHGFKLAFMNVNGLTYLAIINRGYGAISPSQAQVFHVEHPEMLAVDEVCKKLNSNDSNMLYLRDLSNAGSGVGKDFGLVPLECNIDEEKVKDDDPALLGVIASLGLFEDGEEDQLQNIALDVVAGLALGRADDPVAELPVTKKPLEMTPQKVANCALVAAWRDILFRLAHYGMVRDPEVRVRRGVLPLGVFKKWIARAMPVYKRIKSSSRVRSANLAAKILVGDAEDKPEFSCGHVLLFRFIDHMLDKRRRNPIDEYGCDKDILQPALNYLMSPAAEAIPHRGLYIERIKATVGDESFTAMQSCNASATKMV
ncbi:MAG: hypothetical protein P1U63_13275 [Coxiellaceae bacterium]|nr:hypothetical protein [Coxiellaceae bacterium]